ncbi:MAG TPA: ABC transporter transmembrane domain-containing protein, partial [Chloroflexota bacterium]|nr:ABC transporter transmembrane domain-containing protein [Chloroflexota bacterium]
MKLDRYLLSLLPGVRFPLALAVASGLLAGIATVLQALFLSRAIGQVFLGRRQLEQVEPLLFAILGLIALRGALAWARELWAAAASAHIRHQLRLRLFSRLVEAGPAFCRGERTGELANSLMEGIESLDAYFSQYLPSLALAALVPTTILIFVFPLDLVSALVLLVTAPLIPLFMVLIGKMADAMTRRQWHSLSLLSAHFLDVVQGLATLKMFNRSHAQLETIRRMSDGFGEATLSVLRVAFLSALALEMLATISTALVAVEVGLRLLYATISFEQAFFILVLAPEFYQPHLHRHQCRADCR